MSNIHFIKLLINNNISISREISISYICSYVCVALCMLNSIHIPTVRDALQTSSDRNLIQ